MKEEKVYLTLQNGRVFEGKRFGAKGDVVGELVFTTGMTGYIETLTDPSYYGQIVIQTFPLIGNYGVISKDRESKKPYLTAYVVREHCEHPSNFRCEEKLDEFLTRNNVVGVCGVDTRELTKTVREAGVMNAVISSRPRNGSRRSAEIRYTRRGKDLLPSGHQILRGGERETARRALGFRRKGKYRARTRAAR